MYELGMEVFLTIVRNQNITRAAIELNLSQSTVSKRLKILEQEVGMPLIERKQFKLTPAGEAFMTIAEQWSSLQQQVYDLRRHGPRLGLSIAVLDSIIHSFFPPVYHALSHHSPQLQLRIVTMHAYEMYDAIEQGDIDVALSSAEKRHHKVLVEKCYTDPLVVLRHSISGYSLPASIHPRELDSDEELFVDWGATYRAWHDTWWDPLNITKLNRIASALVVNLLLMDAKKWTIVPRSLARAAAATNPLTYQQLVLPPPDRIIYKLRHRKPKASITESLKIFDRHLEIALQNEFD